MAFRRAGFTVIELMITVAIIAVLAVIAAPNLRDLILNARMTSIANNLMTDLAAARSEAVKRGSSTAICPTTKAAECSTAPYTNCACTNSAWNLGWVIFQDSNRDGAINAPTDVIKYSPAVDGATDAQPTLVTVVGAQAGPYVPFLASGVSQPGGVATVTFSVCDGRSLANVDEPVARGKGRKITLSGTGRAQAARCTCTAANVCP